MSESLSIVSTITAPSLDGVWVFDPLEPDETERNYLHADGRTETNALTSSEFEVAGRLNPIIEFGESEGLALDLTITVPFGPDHAVGVDWWRAALKSRRAICYRDNRDRLFYGVLPVSVPVRDVRHGTALSIKLRRVDYVTAI